MSTDEIMALTRGKAAPRKRADDTGNKQLGGSPERLSRRSPPGSRFPGWKVLLAIRPSRRPAKLTLPDIYIRALAAVGQLALLTRDAERCRAYFPEIEILTTTKRPA